MINIRKKFLHTDDTPLVPLTEAGKANGTASTSSTAKTRSRPNNEYVLYSYGEPVGMTNDSGASYFGTDILGSVRNVTDKYGTVQADYSYDAFGSPYLGNLDNDIGFGYCGKVYDIGTGLYDYGFRDYSPNNARFTTVDPIRDGSNWFSYVVNDPVNYVDPLGLSTSDRGSSPKFNSGMFGQNVGGNFSTSNGWVIGNGFAIPQSGATLDGFTKASGIPWSMTSWDQSRNPKSLQVGETIFWNTNLPFSDFLVSNASSGSSDLANAKIFTLNSIAQENLIQKLSEIKNVTDKINNVSTVIALLSMLPLPKSPFLGGASTITSTFNGFVNSLPNEIIPIYYETQVSALKNYFDGKLFDKNCALELNFATLDKYSGKQNDFATVWKMLLEDPNVKLKDLPDKMEIGYFVTLRWKDENGKTLGGKTVQLSNKAEFDELRKMVIAAGGKK